MGLDVSLYKPTPTLKKGTGVFVRENGNTRELSIQEVEERYPESNIQETVYESNEAYSAKITHNLNTMASKAGIYKHLWRPDEIGIETARELIEPLREGLHKLKSNPEKYKAFNPPNGWGDYEGFVRFVSGYLDACYENPDAYVSACR